jgi:hypothetical protein
MKDARKKWISPQLIVLGRGTPEENVLAGCKTTKLAGGGAKNTGCKKNFIINCVFACNASSTS